MGNVTGVQFQKNGKLFYFDSNGLEPRAGDYVIADTVRGEDLGEVVLPPRNAEEDHLKPQLKKIIRIATEQDIQRGLDNRIREKEAFSVCQKKIAEHKLEMKLVSVEYAFDGSKILFFFTANGRVDFRSLVKDLASVFKMRIELRQIGVRDEAKMLGGLGPCGRQICCGSFLEQFQPVSIKMAKEQNLSLNPTKISGVCGRLMCCLKYEQDHYEQARKRMPKVGREVSTPDGTGPVTDLNIVKETVSVRLINGDTSEIKEYPLEQISKLNEAIPAHADRDRKTKSERDQESPQSGKTLKTELVDPDVKNITSEDGQTADQTGSGKNRENGSARNRNRSKGRRGALGQPVKRENPNRSPQVPADDQAKNKGDTPVQSADHETVKESRKEPALKTVKKTSGNSPWAAAVREAMEAIDKDK